MQDMYVDLNTNHYESDLTRKEWRQDKAGFGKDDAKQDGIRRLPMLGNDGAQVFVQVQDEVQQPCNNAPKSAQTMSNRHLHYGRMNNGRMEMYCMQETCLLRRR